MLSVVAQPIAAVESVRRLAVTPNIIPRAKPVINLAQEVVRYTTDKMGL